MKNPKEQKILLSLLPYWTPQIPPVGIACLKGFLQEKGFEVKAVDVNVEEEIRNIYDSYFEILRNRISGPKRGNFYNIGHDVMQNHMMAHLNRRDEKEYLELVRTIIYKTYFLDVEESIILEMNKALDRFFEYLQEYFTELLKKERPAVLGLSTYKGNLPAVVFIFKLAKKIDPSIKTVMGGAVFAQLLTPGSPNFEMFLEQTAQFIDHLIVGEGENLFLELLEGRLDPKQRVFTLAHIDNRVLDLEQATVPDFSDYKLEVYPNMASYSSRSCPYQCKFCTETVYWGKYRKKSAKQIVDELSGLQGQTGNQLYLLSDSLLNPVITDLSRPLWKRISLSIGTDI